MMVMMMIQKIDWIHLKTIEINILNNAFNCATDDLPLTSSDRAEIFTTDTSNYSSEAKLAIFVSDNSIRILRIFFIKKKKVRFLKKLKTTSEI